MPTVSPSSDWNDENESGIPPRAPSPYGRRDDETSLLDLLIVVAERKRAIAAVTSGGAILALIVAFVLPVRYTATVTLLTPQQNSSVSGQLASQFGSLGGMAAMAGGGSLLKNPNDMYVAMLRSRTVEDAMVQRFELMKEYGKKYPSDARKKFEQRAIVDGSGKDGLIHISVEDGDPRRAAELANGYVDQFRQLSEHLAITEAGQRRLFFEQQLHDANQKLGDAEEALKDTEQKTGLIELDSQTRALIESSAALRAQITTREAQMQAMQTYATGENAQVVEAQRELDSLRSQLAKMGGSTGSDGLMATQGKMTEGGIEYVRKLRDVKYDEAIFDILARQYEAAKLDEAKEGAIIQVVDSATPPDRKSFPHRGLIGLAGALAGLLLGIFWVLAQHALGHMSQDPESAQKFALLRRAISFNPRD